MQNVSHFHAVIEIGLEIRRKDACDRSCGTHRTTVASEMEEESSNEKEKEERVEAKREE